MNATEHNFNQVHIWCDLCTARHRKPYGTELKGPWSCTTVSFKCDPRWVNRIVGGVVATTGKPHRRPPTGKPRRGLAKLPHAVTLRSHAAASFFACSRDLLSVYGKVLLLGKLLSPVRAKTELTLHWISMPRRFSFLTVPAGPVRA